MIWTKFDDWWPTPNSKILYYDSSEKHDAFSIFIAHFNDRDGRVTIDVYTGKYSVPIIFNLEDYWMYLPEKPTRDKTSRPEE